MILPTKHISADRALLTIAGQLLTQLDAPVTPTRLWNDTRKRYSPNPIAYQWFVLALDLLFLMGLIELSSDGLVQRVKG